MASYKSQAALVEDEPYKERVRACLLEQASQEGVTPSWDAVYGSIADLTSRAVNRLAPLHAADYDSGVASGMATPSDNVPDQAILSGVQTYWDEITAGVPVVEPA